LDINGKRLELETDSLFNQPSFQKTCVERINMLPPTLRKQDWEAMLNALLREMVELEQIVEASEDTSVTGRFMDLVEEFTTHMQQALDREEMLMGRPWTDDQEGMVYFRMKDLETFLRRNNFMALTAPKIAQRLREVGGDPVSMYLKSRTTRVWRMPKFAKQDAPFETPTSREESPF